MTQLDAEITNAGGPLPNSADVLIYIADMIDELSDLTRRTGCATLASILAVARLEAAQQAAARKSGTSAT